MLPAHSLEVIAGVLDSGASCPASAPSSLSETADEVAGAIASVLQYEGETSASAPTSRELNVNIKLVLHQVLLGGPCSVEGTVFQCSCTPQIVNN